MTSSSLSDIHIILLSVSDTTSRLVSLLVSEPVWNKTSRPFIKSHSNFERASSKRSIPLLQKSSWWWLIIVVTCTDPWGPNRFDEAASSAADDDWLSSCVTIGIFWFPLIPSPISPLVQYCSHLHKSGARDVLVLLLVTPHQTRKWNIPLVLFGFKPQQQP